MRYTMFAIFALIFVTLQVATAQVIPYSSKNAAQGAVSSAYQMNSASGLPGNGIAPTGNLANSIAANKVISERITNGFENVALSNKAANDATFNLAALASNSLAGLNGNVATFNLGGDGHAFTITSGSPGSQGFGIQVLADALEVGGTVSVNGQIPIFGTVSVSGNVPTDGSAAVNYNCGKPAATAVTVENII